MSPTPNSNQQTGKKGEDLASYFLQNLGYKIIERNFQKKHGDIDIVALDGKTLVFIEVKTRKTQSFGLPVEAITARKIKSLIHSAYLYKALHPKTPESMRIDVITIDYSTTLTDPRIEHIKNITL